jgi:hypothetical protein
MLGVGLVLAGPPAWPDGPAVLRVDPSVAGCGDTGGGGKPFCSPAAAIRAANARSGPVVIELAGEGMIYTLNEPSVRDPVEGDTGLPAVTGELTVRGHGAVIERSRAGHTPPFRIFWVADSGKLRLENLTVRGGLTPPGMDGAGLWNAGRLHLEDVIVTENVAGDDGGGIRNDGTLTLSGSTLSLNNASGPGGVGGGLYNVPVHGPGSAAIAGTTFVGNRAGDHGGAVFNSSDVTAVNTTFSGNLAAHNGGAVRNVARMSFNNVTLLNNQAGDFGGGISNIGTLRLSNTAVAGGVAPVSPDCEGHLTSAGYNLIQNRADCEIDGDETGNLTGLDPQLSPLQAMDGGRHKLHRPSTRSPLVDAGSRARPGSGGNACEAADQRGVPRPKDGDHDSSFVCDIGAAEIGPV